MTWLRAGASKPTATDRELLDLALERLDAFNEHMKHMEEIKKTMQIEIGWLIKRERQRLDILAETVYDHVGLKVANLSAIERGKGHWSRPAVKGIVTLFDEVEKKASA